MTKKMIDYYSLEHFFWGFLSQALINNLNISYKINFIICNGIHLLLELNENNISPTGKVLETTENHIGDIFFFLVGWIISYKIKFQNYIPKKILPFLWIFLIIKTFAEFHRELFPYSKHSIFKGAFI